MSPLCLSLRAGAGPQPPYDKRPLGGGKTSGMALGPPRLRKAHLLQPLSVKGAEAQLQAFQGLQAHASHFKRLVCSSCSCSLPPSLEDPSPVPGFHGPLSHSCETLQGVCSPFACHLASLQTTVSYAVVN